MPAGVAVLERLGLRGAVGGRALRGVRYHGFGLTAEAPFPPRRARRAVALAQRRLRLDEALLGAARATPGVRVFEEAPVEGAGARERPRRRAARRRRAPARRAGRRRRRPRLARAALAGARRAARAAGAARRAHALPPGRRTRRPATASRSSSAAATSSTWRRCPTASCWWRPRRRTARSQAARAPRSRAGSPSQPLLRELLDGAEPLTAPAGRTRVDRRARAGFAPGAVLLGDAARATDPLTAGGIAHALVTAERLAAVVPRYLAERRRARWPRSIASAAASCARTTG